MTDRVETQVLYNAMERLVTIRFRPKRHHVIVAEHDTWDETIVLPLRDAMELGYQLRHLMDPIEFGCLKRDPNTPCP